MGLLVLPHQHRSPSAVPSWWGMARGGSQASSVPPRPRRPNGRTKARRTGLSCIWSATAWWPAAAGGASLWPACGALHRCAPTLRWRDNCGRHRAWRDRSGPGWRCRGRVPRVLRIAGLTAKLSLNGRGGASSAATPHKRFGLAQVRSVRECHSLGLEEARRVDLGWTEARQTGVGVTFCTPPEAALGHEGLGVYTGINLRMFYNAENAQPVR
jgi:hypothetical protein